MARVISHLNINGQEADFRDPDSIAVSEIVSGTYAGVNLTEKFASEIDGSPWTWIKNRITNGNFDGLNIGDYIQFTADGNTYKAQIAGINTYSGTGSDYVIGNHIDFVCKELWASAHRWHSSGTNNGTSSEASPWLASEIYGWLNGSDVYGKLPESLRNAIAEKYTYNPTRYSSSGNLGKYTGAEWESVGKLWFPMEGEVFQYPPFNTASVFVNRYCVQYPIFRSAASRIKYASGADTRSPWWLLTGRETPGNSAEASNDYNTICAVSAYGISQPVLATNTSTGVPICFRIA